MVFNSKIFTAAFAGAMSGMGFSDKVPTNPLSSSYASLASVAGAFASEMDTLWGAAPAASLEIECMHTACEAVWQERAATGTTSPTTYTPICTAIIAAIQASIAYYVANGIPNPPFGGGGGASLPLLNLGVNSGKADVFPDGKSVVLRTGAIANLAGGYNGGGTGNKAIIGLTGLDMPASSLASIQYVWKNELGPTGPNYIPPGAGSVLVPYCNLLVDFGGGDLRILVVTDSGLAPAISAAIGTYTNDGFNNITHSWTSAMDVLIVNSPPNIVPGGVPPNVSVGPAWPANSYSWAALLAANPLMKIVTVFPANPVFFPLGDGGMPAGATVPGIVIVSGDSGNVVKSGKTLTSIKVNGSEIVQP